MAAIVPSAPVQPAQDPLFEALVKFVTTGENPSSVSRETVQQVIDAHVNEPGGRHYLESVLNDPVSQNPPVLETWEHESAVHGVFHTDAIDLKLDFTGRKADIRFQGAAHGVFPPQVNYLSDATFYWNDETPVTGAVTFDVLHYKRVNSVLVTFKNSSSEKVAQLQVKNAGLHIGPSSVSGRGNFTKLPSY